MSQEAITVKGIHQGLLVKLGAEGWHAGLLALEEHLAASPAFFCDGRVALDVGGWAVSRSDIEEARTLLARHQVELWAVVGTNPTTADVARDLRLSTDLSLPHPRESRAVTERMGEPLGPLADDLVVRRTLRSGQRLRHPGDIAIIGDVNPGAEVIAGGDIVVWGRVRGILHAGALGDESAVICALDLSPMQLRIAGHIALSPEEKRGKPVPEMASVRSGQIEAVPWRGRERGLAR